MHVTIMTVGSRGDVQPLIALGCGLQARGLQVRIATHRIFAEQVRGCGLEFAPLEGNPQALIQDRAGIEWLRSQHSMLGLAKGFRQLMGPVIQQCMRDGVAAAADSDALIFSGTGYYFAYSVAEKLGLPYVQAYLQPIHPTSEFPSALFPLPYRGGRLYNYATHVIAGMSFWQLLRPVINAARREHLGLGKLSWQGPFPEMLRQQLPVVYGYSAHVVPRPRSWGSFIDVSGFWFFEQPAWTPPQALVDFLAAGPPPVYVGFGSMTDGEPQQLTRMVLKALELSGQRGVLLRGWGGLAAADLPDSVITIDHVDHHWLFPQMAAVVHHGGAGTTAAGLRAGVPTLITPFFGDQPFWGAQVAALGVGPQPIPRAKLSAARLAGAIQRTVSDQAMQTRAAQLGQQLRAEDGVARACATIIAHLQSPQARVA